MVKPKIVIDENTKKNLDEIKLHPRETYGDTIKRLLKQCKYQKQLSSK